MEHRNISRLDERADHKLKKATKEVYKLRKSKKKEPDAMKFR